MKIDKFFGINNHFQDIGADTRESAYMQNFFADDNSLIKVGGSTILATFTDKAGTTNKNICGAYQCSLNGTIYRLVTGGDALKTYAGGAFTDITGTVTITDNDDNRPKFATFKDASANDIAIMMNGVDDAIKWDGSGNADVLTITGLPAGTKLRSGCVHKGRLWACYDDYLVVSDEFNGENYDPLNLIRYINKGEDIVDVVEFNGGVCVMQPTKISFVTGSNYRDFYNQEGIVVGDGPVSGGSVQVVDSVGYGKMIVFISSKDGVLKGFNGSPNLIDIGLPADNLFKIMRKKRREYSVSTVYDNKYFVALCHDGGNTNDKWFVYDFKRDNFGTEAGQPASAIYYMVDQAANFMATWTNSDDDDIFVTGNYSANLVQQDYGLKFEDTETIRSQWQSMKFDFGTPEKVKMITDAAVMTMQSTDSSLSIDLVTKGKTGQSSVQIEVVGDLYDTARYDDAVYGEEYNSYTRTPFNNITGEGHIYGRYFVYTLMHETAEENLKINSVILEATDLGRQQEYIE